MKLKGLILFLLLTAAAVIPSNGQIKSKFIITGYVTDLYHYPVAGAIIAIIGTSNNETRVVTDAKGFYKVRITAPTDASKIIVISSTHGILAEVINGRTRINFTFPSAAPYKNKSESHAEDLADKEEINVGYGKMEKSKITTPISKLNTMDSKYSSYSSIYDMLHGTIPGVQVNQDNILIRGITSIMQSNEPLYIVDGVPVRSIADIPPQFVKSIEVLKGPAAAIYGSRGANGVILIDMLDAEDADNGILVASGTVPIVSTQPATNVQGKEATLNGLVNANDLSAFVTFEYGTTSGYGNKITAVQNPVTGKTASRVSAVVSDLKSGLTYHYRVVATNSIGIMVGIDMPFTTSGEVPSVETGSATNTTPGTAKLNGTVNAHFLQTVVTFEYGTTTDYGNTITASQSPVSGNKPVMASADIRGLKSGTTYHYRIVVSNENGTIPGDDATFKAEYVIGEQLNGGYIFYIDETGEHGLVCAVSDQSQVALWGNCTPPGAAGREIGTGNKNTSDIVNGCPSVETAASLCYNLEMNGYSDWFLPSINELFLMYKNLHEKGWGDFKDSFYWSSTQDKYGAWVVSFYYGNKSNQNRNENAIKTRAIRAF